MKSEWKHFHLGDVVKFSSGGTPNKNKPEYWNGTIPWISAKTMKDEFISSSNLFITEEGLTAGSKLAPAGSLLLLTRGSGLFNGIPVCYVEKSVAFNQDVKCLQTIEGVSSRFIFYWLKSRSAFLQARLDVTGIGAGKFDTDFLKQLEIDIPCLNEQEKIASILDSLTEIIRTNVAINDNLAELMQTVYQKNFGSSDDVAEHGILSDICSYSKDRVAVSELNVNTYYSTENMLPEKTGATSAASLPTTPQTTACHKGNTLISNIRPYFKKIIYCEDECGCSADVLCFAPIRPNYAAYLYNTLYADKFFAFMVAGSKGTKMPRGDKQQIMTYPIVIPSSDALDAFNAVTFPILEQIHANRIENEKLAALRDALLPKLLSGELDVPNC